MMPLRNRLLVGDVLAGMRQIPDESVDMLLTSPPYFQLRRYAVSDDQYGREAAVEQWVDHLAAVADQTKRLLKPTGTLWLNLGDAYALHAAQGAPRKSLLLAPERLALRLIADGWLLRNKIVWQKANPMPTSVRDRLACTYEYTYVFARQPLYFFDLDAVRIPHRTTAPTRSPQRIHERAEDWRGPNTASRLGLRALKAAGVVGHPLGKNPGDVWTLATSSWRGLHRATFPVALADRTIRAGCPEATCTRCGAPWRRNVLRSADGSARRTDLAPTCRCQASSRPGLVLDPFIGSGTTAVAAEALKRDWLGIELSSQYAAEAEQRIFAARAGPRAA